jgi:hypothetical protein
VAGLWPGWWVTWHQVAVPGASSFGRRHGIGHLYYRRAKASQMLFGGPAVYYERLLAKAGV